MATAAAALRPRKAPPGALQGGARPPEVPTQGPWMRASRSRQRQSVRSTRQAQPARSVSAFARAASEVHLEIDVEDRTIGTYRHRIRGVADGTVMDVNELGVEAQAALAGEIPVLPDPELGRVAIAPEDLRSARIHLEA